MAERITRAAQENLISLLAHSNKHGKVIAQLVDPELFEGDYRVIATRVVDYWKQHKKAPRVHTADLLSDVIHDNKNRRSETYKRILRQMSELAASGEININYVMQQLKQFTRLQHMKDAILRSADILQKQQELGIGDVEQMLADLMRAREFNFESGLRLSEGVPRVADYLEKRMSEFALGIPHLDTRSIVPYRNAALLFLAPTGKGKSWFLVRVGKQAIMQRKKVLHVTLEMDEDEVAQRYYQSFFAMPKHEVEGGLLTLPKFKYERPTIKGALPSIIKSITNYEIEPGVSFTSGRGMSVLTDKVQEWKRGLANIIVKRFPMRSITMEDLDAYLDTLEGAAGFQPDLLILDYIGITKTDAKNHRISLGRAFEDFRGLCQRRNIAGVTASQVGRAGMEARTLKAIHVAEDISLINTADVAITYSQTDAEHAMGLARLFVDKARSDEDKFGLVITQAYKTGQFALQSARLNTGYYDMVPGWGGKEAEPESEGDDEGEAEPPAKAKAPAAATRGKRKWRD